MNLLEELSVDVQGMNMALRADPLCDLNSGVAWSASEIRYDMARHDPGWFVHRLCDRVPGEARPILGHSLRIDLFPMRFVEWVRHN